MTTLVLDLSPVYRQFRIVVPEGEFDVEIRQATVGDDERRADIFRKTRRVWNDEVVGETAIEQEFNPVELQRMEVLMTLAGCTLETHAGKAFEFEERRGRRMVKNETAFDLTWKNLPSHIAQAIHERVYEVNPQWDPRNRGE